MVYCRYCGAKNKDDAIICKKCGKSLSLTPSDFPESLKDSMHNFPYKKEFNKDFINDYQGNRGNYNQGSIKSRYNNSHQFNKDFNKKEYKYNQSESLNNLSASQTNFYQDNYRENHKKIPKKYIEWDVVIATALLVIILASILQRFFPTFGLSVALFFGLIYILAAIKFKSTLFKAIPLAIVMVFAISAYFSL